MQTCIDTKLHHVQRSSCAGSPHHKLRHRLASVQRRPDHYLARLERRTCSMVSVHRRPDFTTFHETALTGTPDVLNGNHETALTGTHRHRDTEPLTPRMKWMQRETRNHPGGARRFYCRRTPLQRTPQSKSAGLGEAEKQLSIFLKGWVRSYRREGSRHRQKFA